MCVAVGQTYLKVIIHFCLCRPLVLAEVFIILRKWRHSFSIFISFNDIIWRCIFLRQSCIQHEQLSPFWFIGYIKQPVDDYLLWCDRGSWLLSQIVCRYILAQGTLNLISVNTCCLIKYFNLASDRYGICDSKTLWMDRQ